MASAPVPPGRFQRFLRKLSDMYEPDLRTHLAKMYMSLVCAGAGALLGALLQTQSMLYIDTKAPMVSFLCFMFLQYDPYGVKSYYVRLAVLILFGFSSGQAMDPIMSYISTINATLVTTVLSAVVVLFIALSLGALLTDRGKFLFLGGVIALIANAVATVSFVNIFVQSEWGEVLKVVAYVFLSVAAILFDTQNVLEKRRAGNQDVIQHAFDLLFDILTLYRCLLLIEILKEEHLYASHLKKEPKSVRIFNGIQKHLQYILKGV